MNRLMIYLVACALLACLYLMHKNYPAPSFAQDKPTTPSQIPLFIKNNLPTLEKAPSVHSASITALDRNQLLAVWFAGSGEGKPDVEIYGSVYDIATNLWSEPQSLLNRQRLSQDSHQFIKKLGNPVIYHSSNGDIHLFVVGVTFGGWATSKIYHYISSDGAKSFTYKEVLRLGALANLSFLVRSEPVGLEDGGFYLPIYHELADKYPLIVRFDSKGNMLYSQKLNSLNGLLQPSIVPLDSKECLVAFRNYKWKEMQIQKCSEGGLLWDEPQTSNVLNEGNSIALFRINQVVYLLHNTQEKTPKESRGTLVLSKLDSTLQQWKKIAILDVAQGERTKEKSVEVSYPNVYVNGDIVDIIYTNNRTHISHIRLNQKWILDQANKDQQ